MMIMPKLSAALAALVVTACLPGLGRADDEQKLPLAAGAFQLQRPKSWKRVEPKVRIIEHEFSVPAEKGDEQPGRVTIMAAGGSVEANLDRWYGQFSQPDGSDTKKHAKTEKKKIAGQEVHLIDVSGTYDDRSPFAAQGIKRADYRMLAAIILTKKHGNYFVKFYGPEKTVAKNERAFLDMVQSLEAKAKAK